MCCPTQTYIWWGNREGSKGLKRKQLETNFSNSGKIKWNLDKSNCRGPPRFELWVMLSFCFSHVVTVVSPVRSSVLQFLAKLSKICKIFFSCEKKTMTLSLLHKNVNTSSHRKGNLMALTAVYQFELWLKVLDMPSKLSLPRHAGTRKRGLS